MRFRRRIKDTKISTVSGCIYGVTSETIHFVQVWHRCKSILCGDYVQGEDDCFAGSLHIDGCCLHLYMETGKFTIYFLFGFFMFIFYVNYIPFYICKNRLMVCRVC